MNYDVEGLLAAGLDRKRELAHRPPQVLSPTEARAACLACSMRWQPKACKRRTCWAWQNRPQEEAPAWTPPHLRADVPARFPRPRRRRP